MCLYVFNAKLQQMTLPLQIDPGNEQLLQQHLACAAAELPLHLQYDREFFGHRLPESCKLSPVGR